MRPFKPSERVQPAIVVHTEGVRISIEIDRETDGQWIAEALELPGVMCYGISREDAVSKAERLAIDVVMDRNQHGELPASAFRRKTHRSRA